MKKIKTICIDTLTGIQNEDFMTASKKPNHDEWKDYGSDIWKLISFLQDSGFEIVMVLGEPGTGIHERIPAGTAQSCRSQACTPG